MNKKLKLSIFTNKVRNLKKNIPLKKNSTIKNIVVPIRHFPPATKEWYNSIYTFNKNSIKNLTVANNNLSNIIKSYFNFYFNRKVLSNKKLSIRFRRLAMKNIFISKAEIKHTTKKVREIISVSEGLRRYMDETNDYYIWRLNSYVPVNSKRELLKIMYDHKKDIQKFIRKNDLDLKDDKDNALTQVAAYFDKIAN